MFDTEFLNWLSNFVNALIFAYLSVNVVNTQCFKASEMFLSLIGLLSSIFVQVVVMILNKLQRNNLK